jgi:predicted dehydrogenase
MLEFPNGALAQFECSIEGFRQAQAEIMGTEGQIVLESPWVPGENQAQFTLCHGDRREVVMTAGANCFRLEIEDFVQAFRTHRPLRWPPEDPIHNMAAIDALRESAQEGVAVPVEQG